MSHPADSTVVRLKDFQGSSAATPVSRAMSSIAAQLAGAAKSTDGLVRANPWRAVGAVALAGLAAGLVTTVGARRLRRRAAERAADGRNRDVLSSEASGG